MRNILIVVSIMLCFAAIFSQNICAEETDKNDVLSVANKYLSAATGPTTGTMEQVSKDMQDFASLFDFENLKSSASVTTFDQLAAVYKQLKTEKEREAYNLVFAGNYVSAFQKARLTRVGYISKEDYVMADPVFSDNNSKAAVVIKDKKLGTTLTLLLHKKNNIWLIYSLELKGDASNTKITPVASAN